MSKREAVFTKDTENKKIQVVRTFDASLERVWAAWTQSDLLDKWWAPKPYHVETKSMDFSEGGYWLYAMVSPQGEKTWCIEKYKTIEPLERITNVDAFCDEEGNPNDTAPLMHWKKEFAGTGNATTVHIELRFDEETGMETILKMGFEGGFTMGLNNLDELLSRQEV
ncbi:MAG: SRPBCC domain-containing protein [Mucilaginibacter sp.]